MLKELRGKYLFILPSLIFIFLFLIYPILYNVNLSFKNTTLINLLQGSDKYIGFMNYLSIFKDPIFLQVLSNTLLFTIVSIFFQFTFGFLLALFFNSSDFPLKNFLQNLLMLPWFIPIIVKGHIWRWFFSDMGTINSFLIGVGLINNPIPWISSTSLSIYSLIIANIWLGIPFNFILLYTGLKGLPVEMYEAAEIDGANFLQKTLYITIPSLKPVIITTIMMGCVFTIKVFDLAWIITKGGPANSSHLLSTFSYSLSMEQSQFGLGATVSTIMILLVCLITMFFNFQLSKD